MRILAYGAGVTLLAFGATLAVLSWVNGPKETSAPDMMPNADGSVAMAAKGMAGGGDMTMGTDMTHSHPMREVAAGLPVPAVTHLVFPDAMDGYNIQILTENFTFTPSAINRDIVPNEGHAHLYVNGEKVLRVYGRWVHLPASFLVTGANVVTVTLNANDHSEWANDGMAIGSSVIVVKPDLSADGMRQSL